MPSESLSLEAVGQRISIACNDAALSSILVANFGAMAVADPGAPAHFAHFEYRVEFSASPSPRITLIRSGSDVTLFADTPGDFLFAIEKDITVELQKRRSDLYFLHSAAVAFNNGCYLLAAESGNGKSTTTWGLLHRGFDYMSDELGAIDLESMNVHPYPHALCLKKRPAANYPLPEALVDLGRTLHLPARTLPGTFRTAPLPLRAVLIVKHDPTATTPSMRPITSAEAAARLYVVALNALAHENRGLDASVRIAEHVPCFTVSTGDLAASCAMIGSEIRRIDAAAL